MTNSNLPHLVPHGTTSQLIVNGEPFLIRGGELGNSSMQRAYLEQYWPHLVALNLNAIVAPVYWDVLEPKEGEFDWTTVDELLEDARAHSMKIVLLWFASWKNSMSSYVPAWVKTNQERFPRARQSNGAPLEILSPFYQANWDADAHAFTALLKHLREVDTDHTVVLVQVENEIGMIPEARDHTAAANEAWAAPVPSALMGYLKAQGDDLDPSLAKLWRSAGGRTSGSWTEVFGDSPAAEEVFQAYAFARYCEHIAAAGRAELDLPMYTNAALPRTGTLPGQYPSAGPLPHLADIWRAGAPHLDFIAPDIYFPEFAKWTDAYVASGNPLFVPEALRSVDAAANALYAFGKHGAIGFAPFGIES
ncbi:MAG: beta-galactosidase, partial [Promicromonosporaceae bacterium]|nr:beta-galactosidase [Promicromonosporaceae bacterium]